VQQPPPPLFSRSTSQSKKKNQHEISKTQTPIEPLIASLAHPLSSRLGQAVDILVFNPPYVPTSDDEAGAAQHGAGIA
jgi:methylase of polypeptide subunit release factors